jgi:phosphatidylglycerophosphatase A
MISFFSKIVSTIFFVGYVPFAPGTIGTLIAFLSVYLLKPNDLEVLFFVIFGLLLGIFCSHITEKNLKEKDSQKIVIDEFIGYMASLIFLPLTNYILLSSFILFRFFDILKPFPIRILEKKIHGGLGIMLDDLVAALYTNLLLRMVIIFI